MTWVTRIHKANVWTWCILAWRPTCMRKEHTNGEGPRHPGLASEALDLRPKKGDKGQPGHQSRQKTACRLCHVLWVVTCNGGSWCASLDVLCCVEPKPWALTKTHMPMDMVSSFVAWFFMTKPYDWQVA